MLANGMQQKEIAWDLGISLYTVKEHIKRIRRKADAPTMASLIAYAFRNGWIK